MRKLLSTIALFTTLSFGADVTGSWTGPMQMTRDDGESRDDHVVLVLTQEGKEIKGTAGPNEEKQMPIEKGSIEGSEIVLEVAEPNGGSGRFTIRLKVDGDKMTGDLKGGNDNHVMTGKMTLTRAK